MGLEDLEYGCNMKDGLRQVLCVMTLLSYHLIVLYVLSHHEGDLAACENILKTQLQVSYRIRYLCEYYNCL